MGIPGMEQIMDYARHVTCLTSSESAFRLVSLLLLEQNLEFSTHEGNEALNRAQLASQNKKKDDQLAINFPSASPDTLSFDSQYHISSMISPT
jgi:hypothetical protein